MRIILVFLMLKMSLFGSSLKIGENAPNFILNDQDGKQHQLSDYKGKKLVIYFLKQHSQSKITFLFLQIFNIVM